MTYNSDKRHLKRAGAAVTSFLLIPVAVLWAWNSGVTELFGASRMDYGDALGVVILAVLAGWCFRGGGRRFAFGQSGHHSEENQ